LQIVESVARNLSVEEQSYHHYRVSDKEIYVNFVTVDDVAEDDTVKNIMRNILLENQNISFIAAFQPSSK